MSKVKEESNDTKKKIILKPKISLDNEILKVMNKHYSSYLGEELIGRECFSAPDLDSHICNITAKEDGGKKCMKCGNIPGRPCEITCDVHHFCLAAYSVRLGLSVTGKRTGGDAITYNLRHYDYKGLYKEVISRMELLQVEEEVEEAALDADAIHIDEALKKEVSEGKLISYSDAATLLKCSHKKVVAQVQRGLLNKITLGATSYLKRDEVEKFCKEAGEVSK